MLTESQTKEIRTLVQTYGQHCAAMSERGSKAWADLLAYLDTLTTPTAPASSTSTKEPPQ